MKVVVAYMIFLCSAMFICSIQQVYSQQSPEKKTSTKDTFFLAKKKGWLGKLAKSIAQNTPDDIQDDATTKNINTYLPHKDKIIENIYINHLKFGASIYDTNKVKNNFLTEAANSFHSNTKNKTIYNNLFFKKGEALSPNIMADNERYLREISFLQDARIFILPTISDTNKVDVWILYKDVFAIGGEANLSNKAVFAEFKNDNVFGTGQRLLIQNLFDLERKPKYGFGVEYLKRNVNGSFFDVSVGFQNLASGFNTGKREETNLTLKVDLPLVSPYFLWTGSAEASVKYTNNRYHIDSIYQQNVQYKFYNFDVWAGYNITFKTFFDESVIRKPKQFVAVRIINKQFQDIPNQFKQEYNSLYANIKSVLAAYTLFKQEYYRTNYLYGFGRNEDVPEGYSYSFLGGWASRDNVSRPYVGVDIQRYFFTQNRNYYNYNIRLGSYYNNGKIQDASILINLESFSRLKKFKQSNWSVRHFFGGSITHQFRTFLDDPISLNSIYGIQQFRRDSATDAFARFSINIESVFFNSWKLAGFSFAPFAFSNLSYIRNFRRSFASGEGYAAIGAGIKSRNENLIFGTMELKTFYFPRTTGFMTPWNITFNTNLRFRYNSQYITRPEFVSVN
ncbi:MAG: hypothetical protein ACOVNY_09205 [Chitinophagaceae bacterium]